MINLLKPSCTFSFLKKAIQQAKYAQKQKQLFQTKAQTIQNRFSFLKTTHVLKKTTKKLFQPLNQQDIPKMLFSENKNYNIERQLFKPLYYSYLQQKNVQTFEQIINAFQKLPNQADYSFLFKIINCEDIGIIAIQKGHHNLLFKFIMQLQKKGYLYNGIINQQLFINYAARLFSNQDFLNYKLFKWIIYLDPYFKYTAHKLLQRTIYQSSIKVNIKALQQSYCQLQSAQILQYSQDIVKILDLFKLDVPILDLSKRCKQKGQTPPNVVHSLCRLILRSQTQSKLQKIKTVIQDNNMNQDLISQYHFIMAKIQDGQSIAAIQQFNQLFYWLFVQSTKQRVKLLLHIIDNKNTNNKSQIQAFLELCSDDYCLELYNKFASKNQYFQRLIDKKDIFKHWQDLDSQLRFKQIAKGYGLSQYIQLKKKETLVGLFQNVTNTQNLQSNFNKRIEKQRKNYYSQTEQKLILLDILIKLIPDEISSELITKHQVKLKYNELSIEKKRVLASYGILLNICDPSTIIDKIIWVVQNNLTKIDPLSSAALQYNFIYLNNTDRKIKLSKLRNSFIRKNFQKFALRNVQPQNMQKLQQKFKNLIQNNIRINLQSWIQSQGLTKVPGNYLDFIQEMIILGQQTQQPLAVYLAQKVALLAGQVIPHHIAIRASQFLALNKQQPQYIFQRAKNAIQLIGGIDRQKIYDPRQNYRHIIIKKDMLSYLQNVKESITSPMDPYIDAILNSTSPLMYLRGKNTNKQLLKGVDLRLNKLDR